MRSNADTLVPAQMKYAPTHWVTKDRYNTEEFVKDGSIKTRKYKIKGITAAQAQRLRNGIQSLLESIFIALETSDWVDEDKENYKKDLIRTYNRESYSYFSECLLSELNRWNEVDTEETEEIEESGDTEEATIEPTEDELRKCLEMFE